MFYPELDSNLQQNLILIEKYAKDDPQYFDKSPYGAKLISQLKKLVALQVQVPANGLPVVVKVSNTNEALQRRVDLYTELTTSLAQIQEIREDFSALTTKEKVAVIAAINTTVTKMSDVLSKLDESIDIEKFKLIVMQTIEDFLSAEQKEQFLRQLKSVV